MSLTNKPGAVKKIEYDVASYVPQTSEQIKAALKRTDLEKFLYLMELIRSQRMMQKAVITHKK